MKNNDQVVDWAMVNNLVKPEHQYKDVPEDELPLDQVRMAWPFKTEYELKLLSKWFRKQDAATKRLIRAKLEEALL